MNLSLGSFITVEIEELGVMELRSDFTILDIEILQRLVENEEADSRDFVIEAIKRLLHEPDVNVDELKGWSRSSLEHIVIEWSKQQQDPVWELSQELDVFDAFEQAFRNYVANFWANFGQRMKEALAGVQRHMATTLAQSVERYIQPTQFQETMKTILAQNMERLIQSVQFQETMKAINKALQEQFKVINESIQEHLRKIAETSTFVIETGRFFENLPDFGSLAKTVEPYVRAAETVEEEGFRFVLGIWALADVVPFLGIDQIDEKVRPAAVTNRLLSLTRNEQFADDLQSNFERSSVLRRRWPIVERALMAHIDRNYALSIPTLLAQVEGIFTDALILKQLVVRISGKIYARDSTGQPKLNKKGKPIELSGLGQKVDNSDLRDEHLLALLAEFFANGLVSDRNSILHGSNLSYNRAKLSVQLVLNIYILAAEFADFESEN
ncbi:MAG: hypothetical protein GXY61_05755 [Lentisphaerae bacterium]|nr:hypothetical protein [Lentisphaerota bacterium]